MLGTQPGSHLIILWKTEGDKTISFRESNFYSTNGTYLNGNRLERGKPAILNDQDEIAFGERLATKLIPKLSPFVG